MLQANGGTGEDIIGTLSNVPHFQFYLVMLVRFVADADRYRLLSLFHSYMITLYLKNGDAQASPFLRTCLEFNLVCKI